MPNKTTEQSLTVYMSQSKDYRVIFTNSFRLRMGETDIGMSFGYQTQRPAEGDQNSGTMKVENFILDEAEVVVTPIQLKYISEVIRRGITDYENRFGEIALPSAMTAQLTAIDVSKGQKT